MQYHRSYWGSHKGQTEHSTSGIKGCGWEWMCCYGNGRRGRHAESAAKTSSFLFLYFVPLFVPLGASVNCPRALTEVQDFSSSSLCVEINFSEANNLPGHGEVKYHPRIKLTQIFFFFFTRIFPIPIHWYFLCWFWAPTQAFKCLVAWFLFIYPKQKNAEPVSGWWLWQPRNCSLSCSAVHQLLRRWLATCSPDRRVSAQHIQSANRRGVLKMYECRVSWIMGLWYICVNILVCFSFKKKKK